MFGDFVGASDIRKNMSQGIETFFCATYGYPFLTTADLVGKETYVQKCEKEDKSTEFSLLPPCAVNLYLHTE